MVISSKKRFRRVLWLWSCFRWRSWRWYWWWSFCVERRTFEERTFLLNTKGSSLMHTFCRYKEICLMKTFAWEYHSQYISTAIFILHMAFPKLYLMISRLCCIKHKDILRCKHFRLLVNQLQENTDCGHDLFASEFLIYWVDVLIPIFIFCSFSVLTRDNF